MGGLRTWRLWVGVGSIFNLSGGERFCLVVLA
jgi:hypothetical protein